MKIKRKLLPALLLGAAIIASMMTGCGNTSSNDTKEENTTAQSTEHPKEEKSGIIKPVDTLSLSDDALADGGYSVSFTADDFVQNDKGIDLTVEVFSYDSYKKEDIDQMKSGDKIQVCGEVIEVETIERNEGTKKININGGIENDGIELSDEEGFYRTIHENDYPVYYSIGKVTIPLSQDATLEDHFDQEKEPDGVVYTYKELPEVLKNIEKEFSVYSTVITVRQGKIVQVIRYWMP